MAANDIVHVAVTPPAELDPNLIGKVAAILNKETYDTRLLLAGQLPRIIAHAQTLQAAKSMAESLRELGFQAVVCGDSDLRKPLEKFRAHAVQLDAKEALFRDRAGRERKVAPDDIFLIVEGEKEVHIEQAKIDARMKFSLPATILTGGFPIWRRVREQTGHTAFRREHFVRLYDRALPEAVIEAVEDDMNYSFLGAEMASSSRANFAILVSKLQEVFTHAVFEDGLMSSDEAKISFKHREDLEAKMRLICLFHIARS